MQEGQNMRWPTTLIIVAVIGSVTTLGWQGTVDGQAVVAIYSSIIGAVSVGHYVKTINGAVSHRQPSDAPHREGETL